LAKGWSIVAAQRERQGRCVAHGELGRALAAVDLLTIYGHRDAVRQVEGECPPQGLQPFGSTTAGIDAPLIKPTVPARPLVVHEGKAAEPSAVHNATQS